MSFGLSELHVGDVSALSTAAVVDVASCDTVSIMQFAHVDADW